MSMVSRINISSNSCFFQVVRHFERELGNQLKLRIHSSSAMGFPASDIKAIKHHQGGIEISLAVMGLIGVDGCLPPYFSQSIDKSEQGQRLKLFLDIFQHLFYMQMYNAWKASNPDIEMELGNMKWLNVFKRLMPQLKQSKLNLGLSHCMKSNKPTASGVAYLISQLLPQYQVQVKIVAKYVATGQQPFLGQTTIRLGQTTTLSGKLLSAINNIEICFLTLSSEQLFRLREKKQEIIHCLKSYLDLHLQFSLVAWVKFAKPLSTLGHQQLMLGQLPVIHSAQKMLVKL